MLGSKATDNRLTQGCWNEEPSRKSYVRSQSEKPHSNLYESAYQENKVSHATQLPRTLNGGAWSDSEKATLNKIPGNFSNPNTLVDLPVLGDGEQRTLKLRKTVSSETVELENLVAINIPARRDTPPKLKQEPRWFPNQFARRGKPLPRRSSLPASYLENFLSVNNIRKRAISNPTMDSEDGVIFMKADSKLSPQNSTRRGKNAGRKKVRPNSNEEHVVTDKEEIEQIVPAIEINVTAENDDFEDDGRPKPKVSFVTTVYLSVTVGCARLSSREPFSSIPALHVWIRANDIILWIRMFLYLVVVSFFS